MDGQESDEALTDHTNSILKDEVSRAGKDYLSKKRQCYKNFAH